MKALQYFDKKQRTIFLSVMAFAIVAIVLTAVLVLTNEKDEYEEPSLVVNAVELYQYAVQEVGKQYGEFNQDTYVSNLNQYLASDSMLVVNEMGLLSTSVLDEYDQSYIVHFISTEHIQLISIGKDASLGTDDDKIVNFVITKNDDFIQVETRTNQFNTCNHEQYEIKTEPTCTTPGEHRYVCKNCGAENVKFTNPIAHTFDANGDCTICGEKNNIVEGE